MIARALGSTRSSSGARTSCATAGRRRPARIMQRRRDRRGARPARRAHELGSAVRPRQRHACGADAASPSASRPHLAHHLGRDRQRLRRRQLHALLQHRRHGPGLRHRDGADRRRGAQHRRRVGARRASRHRRDALRHGDARLALDCSTWATRCGSRPRTRKAKIAALAHELGLPEGSNMPLAELFAKQIRHAGRQHHRHRQLSSRTTCRPIRDRADAERDAVLDGRRGAAPRSRSTPRPATSR